MSFFVAFHLFSTNKMQVFHHSSYFIPLLLQQLFLLSVTATPMPFSPPRHICPALLPSDTHSSSWKYNLIPSKKPRNSQHCSFSFTLGPGLKALIIPCSVSFPPSLGPAFSWSSLYCSNSLQDALHGSASGLLSSSVPCLWVVMSALRAEVTTPDPRSHKWTTQP